MNLKQGGAIRSKSEGLRRVRKFLHQRKNDLIYGLTMVGLVLVGVLPHGLGMRLGALLGTMAFYVLGRERRRALTHVAVAFGGELDARTRHKIVRESFAHLGMNFVEIVNFPRIKEDLARHVLIEGKEHFDRALAEGKGLLVITAHMGNWELLACMMARHGYALNVVARQIYDARLNRLLVSFRERQGVRVILRESPSAGRQILQSLKKGEVLAMLIDQDTKVKGVMADFFGRKANTPAGAAILARRRPIPVVAGFITRVSSRQHRIEVYPPIEIERTEDISRDLQVNTEKFNKIIEQHIRKYPQQWVWIHRRWRRQAPYDAPP